MNRVISFIIIMSLLLSCNKQVDQQIEMKPPTVTIRTIIKQYTGIPVIVAGRIMPGDEIKLSFKKGGSIEDVFVKEGETVRQGVLLARLKQTEFESVRTQAQLTYDKTARDFERISNLYRDSVATLEQFQNARTALEMARQSLESALFNIEHSVIRAPSDGKILRKLASSEEIIGEGMPVLLFGSTESKWVLQTSVSDRDVVRISIGDSAGIYLDAWPDISFPAVVSEISGMADTYTGTFDIELMLDHIEKELVAGLIGQAVIYPSDQSWYWLVPTEALIEGDGRHAEIYQFKDGKATMLTLQVEAIRGDFIYARDLHADTLQIIVAGHQYISDGMTVQLAPEL